MTRRSLTIVATTVVVALGAAALLPAPGIGQTDTTPQDTVTVTAAGEVEGRPDLASVAFGIAVRADTAEGAMDELAGRQNAVIDALRNLGLTEEQVTTGGVNLGPACRYDRNLERRVCEGYRARTSVHAETTDLDRVGAIVDAGVRAGATSIRGISFERTEQNEAIREALAEAMDLARTKAEVLATRAGRQLGRAMFIEEGGAPRPVFAVANEFRSAASGASLAADIVFNPADEITRVKIIVTFALN